MALPEEGTGQRTGERPYGRPEVAEVLFLHVSSQLTQLQVKMGPSEWALKPDLARQEYDDVSPCPCQVLSNPQLPHPLHDLSSRQSFSLVDPNPPLACPGADWT